MIEDIRALETGVLTRGCIILLIYVVAVGPSSLAATLTTRVTPKGAEISITGDIAPGDAEALEALMRRIDDSSQPVRMLHLDSPGGNLVGGIALARFIRRHVEVSIVVDDGATCASACFLAFSAGAEKYVSANSFVGVHGAADRLGHVTADSVAATVAMARITAELGVPPQITQKIVATAPSEIAWLTADDLRSMGVTIVAVIARRQKDIRPIRAAYPFGPIAGVFGDNRGERGAGPARIVLAKSALGTGAQQRRPSPWRDSASASTMRWVAVHQETLRKLTLG